MEVKELFEEDLPEEAISAFAFNVGRLLEHIVKTTSDNAIKRNMELEDKIFQYRSMIADVCTEEDMQEYDKHFGIETLGEGDTGNGKEEHKE